MFVGLRHGRHWLAGIRPTVGGPRQTTFGHSLDAAHTVPRQPLTVEYYERTLVTIAGSLLRIFVRMEKLDASLGHLSRRITDIENLNKTSARRGSSTESTAPEASDDRFLHTGDSHSRRSE